MLIMGAVCVVAGGGTIGASLFDKKRRKVLEALGGISLLMGIVLAGAGLPYVV